MTWSYVGGSADSGNSSSASVTHGLTINSGDLVVAYLCLDGTADATADDAGWTEAHSANATDETDRHKLYWREAGGSEPSSYSWDLGSSRRWQAHVRVYRGSGPPTVDLAANGADSPGNDDTVRCKAIDSRSVSAGAVSVVFGGKDNRNASAEAYTAVLGNDLNPLAGWGNVLGDTANQAAGSCDKIHSSGETLPSELRIATTDGDDGVIDDAYSIHMSFIEGAAAEDTVTSVVADQAGTPLANQTGITWWWQESAGGSVVDSGTGATTNASGTMEVNVTNTALTSGQTGYISVELNDGNVGMKKDQVD